MFFNRSATTTTGDIAPTGRLGAVPDMLPVLSPGRHRNPRKGACFMELASYLAGERWSDHPQCTHAVLAALARDVNDQVGDDPRGRLLPLIPEVIGLVDDDPRIDALIAREAALAALPIVAADKQNVAAAAVLACERRLATLEGRDPWEVSRASAAALAEVPVARRWAQDFPTTIPGGIGDFNRRSALVIVHVMVAAIGAAVLAKDGSGGATPRHVDDVLVDLLQRAIAVCRAQQPAAPQSTVPQSTAPTHQLPVELQLEDALTRTLTDAQWQELAALTSPRGRRTRA